MLNIFLYCNKLKQTYFWHKPQKLHRLNNSPMPLWEPAVNNIKLYRGEICVANFRPPATVAHLGYYIFGYLHDFGQIEGQPKMEQFGNF